ncbi:hypothetical protein KUH03_41800 [Sphingobacterium sp. E70]|uniref:hypothetical protein n=1 Tax=Sphingobacterium sp. E70 TaxID=2853439 RepID=UPI00211BDFFD|nr:hypothetical protein [Sphingobacterium sp. E70]ULT25283.1 hypothetical protein KUH03_41800 [Sphingobacterium sp. E70]
MLTFKCGVVLAGMSLQSIDTLAFSQSATHNNQRILLVTALKKVEGKTGLVFFIDLQISKIFGWWIPI